jgi:hypothetical protein
MPTIICTARFTLPDSLDFKAKRAIDRGNLECNNFQAALFIKNNFIFKPAIALAAQPHASHKNGIFYLSR